jgi:hypothetical protein
MSLMRSTTSAFRKCWRRGCGSLPPALWKFATRSSSLVADPDIEPSFGKPYAFAIPTDFVRLRAITSDPDFTVEVADYDEENGVWYTNIETIYIKYVSNDVSYGLNLGLYPENYCAAFGTHMALRAALPITRDKATRNDLVLLNDRMLSQSKRLDAVDESVKRKPTGRLVGSRVGFGSRPQFANGKIRF